MGALGHDMFLAVPLLLALLLPSAWPELCWVLIALLLLRWKMSRPTAQSVAPGPSLRPKSPGVWSVGLQVAFIVLIGISKFFVKYSPWLPEASIAALLLHTVYILVVPEQSKDEEASQAPAAPAASKVPRDSKKLEKVEKAEKLDKAKPKARKGLASLDVSRWADLEEEDEFQEVLAAKLGNAKPSTAAEAPAEAANTAAVLSEEVEAVEADPEPDRPKRKAKAKKPREGGVRKDETPNPWAARIRSCGKAKDLEGALQAADEALSSGVSSRQHQEIQNALLHAMVQCGDAAGETATELFNQLKAEKKADVVTFNIMLRSLLCAGKRDEAQALLRDMREHGLSANKVTIAELLSDRTRAHDAEGVWRIVDWMQSTDFGITNAACSILLKRIGPDSEPSEVDRSFSLIDELSEPLDEALCSQAVEAAIRTQRPQLASRFMEAGMLRANSLRNEGRNH